MNKTLIAALLLVCAGPLYAKEPSKKIKAEMAALTAATTQQMALDSVQSKKAEQAKAAAAKQEQDAEESVVMIDSKTEETESPAAYGMEGEDRLVPGGLPSSYGQCKGTITDAGRNIMIFESLDDGSLSFVQVTVGKANVSWKLIDRVPRSAD
ncbi:MAG: hypothetical protein PHV36_03980 [Elusimicrobiales bacterium]|nr:hypothetical protein [Elusimicrobiales bacterium]